MTDAKILAFAGSNKRTSVNRKALAVAVDGARDAGADVTVLDLKDYPLPIMDEDLEAAEGLPENAAKLQAIFGDHDGFLIACPEYNGLITPLLKNTIDWVSRPGENGSGLQYYKGKTAALVAASPGGLGGLRGLTHVRALMTNLGAIVLPNQVAVSGARKLFDEDGTLNDDAKADQLRGVGAALAQVTGALKS